MEFTIGFHIKTLSNLIKKRIDYLSRDTEITGFQRYLMGYLIAESSKRDVFQRDVEKTMEISRASVTSVLQILEKNGFIRRELVKNDARLKKIVVTEKGLKLHNENIELMKRLDDILLEGISEEEMAVFQSVLMRMKMNLEKDT